jgi:hypothetical protein
MRKNKILTYVKLDLTKQVSKPKKKVEDLQLNNKDFVSLNGVIMDKASFNEWESDKRNNPFE